MDTNSRKLIETIKAKLVEMNLTVSAAESLTTGNVQAAFGSVSGASRFFVGGVCCYNLDQKVHLLGVDREHAASCDCVSKKTAMEMADGCLEMFGSDIAIATTGHAEPCPEQGIKTSAAFLCIRFRESLYEAEVEGPGLDRIAMQLLVTERALKGLAFMLGIYPHEYTELS